VYAGTIDVPRPIRVVLAAATAKTVTASGLVPPTVVQTMSIPSRSACSIASIVACAAGREIATPIVPSLMVSSLV
jgi:hypothetical protein